MGLTVTESFSVQSPNGNSLAVFIEAQSGEIKLKDVNGKVEALSDYVSGSPYRYNTSQSTAIEPVLCCNSAAGFVSVISGGRFNCTLGTGSIVVGGSSNQAQSGYTTVVGGYQNLAVQQGSFVGGGGRNRAIGNLSVVSGGQDNRSCGNNSTIGGGVVNCAIGAGSTISGGNFNTASFEFATIIGGISNAASAIRTTIGGGASNTASGTFSAIFGGRNNTTSGVCSFIGGGAYNLASGIFSTILGGNRNCTQQQYSTIGGGRCNTSASNYGVIAGGICNSLIGFSNQSTIGGGCRNTVTGGNSVVSGGGCNAISCSCSSISGGYKNASSANFSTIGGGCCNLASSIRSAILGGSNNNTASFADAMIVGSCLTATQACTTFVNCLSADNLTPNCYVKVGTNKVLENVAFAPSTKAVGSFYDTSIQSALGVGSPTAMTLNSTDISNNVSVVGGSQITVLNAGIYNLQFSAQLYRAAGGTTKTIDIWLRKNGVNVPYSDTVMFFSNNTTYQVAAWNFIVNLAAGGNVELMYSVQDTDIKIQSEPENLIVPHPAVPSLIVSMTEV
jgi:hypothetical protein